MIGHLTEQRSRPIGRDSFDVTDPKAARRIHHWKNLLFWGSCLFSVTVMLVLPASLL